MTAYHPDIIGDIGGTLGSVDDVRAFGERLAQMPPERLAELHDVAAKLLAANACSIKWVPQPGPQTEAYYCKADILLYGGQAGGGKTDLLAGLAMTQHRRSLLMRREYTDLGSLTERCIMLNKTRDGFNGSLPPKLLTPDERRIDFGACKDLGDEQTWQGNPHDLIGFDEAVQFLRPQVDFVLGWNRSTIVGQRRRAIRRVPASKQWSAIPCLS